jgi:hypothetical protein
MEPVEKEWVQTMKRNESPFKLFAVDLVVQEQC